MLKMTLKTFYVSCLVVSAGVAVAALAARKPPAEPPTPAYCTTGGNWLSLSTAPPKASTIQDIVGHAVRQDVVLLGEQHDLEDHHRWQLQMLAALHAQRPDMVIGFEMFPRRVQPALDRWVAGDLTVKDFLAQSEWDKVWNMSPELYMPLFQFARLNRIPMVALNVERSLTQAITEKGWDAVPEAEREGVGRPAPPSKDYRAFLDKMRQHHLAMRSKEEGAAMADNKRFDFFIESQTTWDRAMAEALAARLVERPDGSKPLVVGVMGNGHIRYGHGVPHQLGALGVSRVASLMPVPAEHDCEDLAGGLADAVFVLPPQAKAQPEPPRLGVRLEQQENRVRIVEVTPGSLAERTGLKNGDQLVEVAGVAAQSVTPVVAQVRSQPAGTWLPLRVQRGSETLELVVKFPVQR